MYRNSIQNKETEIKYCLYKKNVFYVTHEFRRFLHCGWANFSSAKNLIFGKIMLRIAKVVNFWGFLRPDKEIKYFSRTFQDDY